MSRDQERASRTQQRRSAYDDHSIYKPESASSMYDEAPRRRRSQAARMQSQTDEYNGSTYYKESQDSDQRDTRTRSQLPERPRMRQYADEDVDRRSGRYEDDEQDVRRPQSRVASIPSERNAYQKVRSARMLDIEDDYENDDEIEEPKKKRKAAKWIVLVFVLLLFIVGGVFLLTHPDIVEPFVTKVFSLIGPAPTVEPTSVPTPEPTEIPKVPLEMAIVNQFSIAPEGEINVNATVTLTVETSTLTDRIRIVDENKQELLQLSGSGQYIDLEDGRTWNAMYTFIGPYEGVLEVQPGNESGWNDENGSRLDIVVIDNMEQMPVTDTGAYTIQQSTLPVNSTNMVETILAKNEPVTTFARSNAVQMGDSEAYAGDTGLKGVLTFRGDNLRQNAAYGTVSPSSKTLESTWMVNVGVPGDGGRMWNVQPLIIQWHLNTREKMNMTSGKADKKELKEVVYTSNDSKIYFIDLEDGSITREKVSFKTPLSMLTTPSVYPSGMPIMFTGTGDPAYLAEDVQSTGLVSYNLMDGTERGFIRGYNENSLSQDATFITAPLIDRNTSTMIAAGGNGILYTSTLNIDADRETLVPKFVSPTTEMYITTPENNESADATVYSALAAYGDITYYATQGGILQAVNINTLQSVWALDLGQETDAAISLDVDASGSVALYTASRPDSNGMSHIRRIDGLTGTVIWDMEVAGAVSASMLIGKQNISDLLYVAVEEDSVLHALNKSTGESVWVLPLKASKASAPIALYDVDGTAYIVQGDEGVVHLLDGQTGDVLSTLDVEGTVVGSPAAFDEMITLSTSAGKLYGITVK